jgi:membrane-associated two-gene conflict system component 1 (EACC1)
MPCGNGSSEPELRGRIHLADAPAPAGTMGSVPELVVAATAAAGVFTALARSLSVWLVQRRGDLEVKVTGPDGRQVSVKARRVDAEQLHRAVLESPGPSALEEQ